MAWYTQRKHAQHDYPRLFETSIENGEKKERESTQQKYLPHTPSIDHALIAADPMSTHLASIRSIHKCGSHDHQRYYPVRHQGPNLSRLRCFPVGKSCTESSQFIPSTVERQKIDSPSQDSRQLASLILFILSLEVILFC